MKSDGFTLIELVVVIVILGVLATTAIPKFVNLSAEAKTSTLQGVKATMQGAANMVYNKALVKGNHRKVDDSITLQDGEFLISFGYPFASEADWSRIIILDDDFNVLVVGATSARSFIVYRADTEPPTNFSSPCILYYRAPSGIGLKPQFTLNECI